MVSWPRWDSENTDEPWPLSTAPSAVGGGDKNPHSDQMRKEGRGREREVETHTPVIYMNESEQEIQIKRAIERYTISTTLYF
jgi:hypothetical protein